jgi:hypothetical protein
MEAAAILSTGNPDLQIYGLVFLLGSLTVSSLSDLRRLAAQKDFSEIWGFFTILLLTADVYFTLDGQSNPTAVAVKWTMIFIFIAATTTHYFNISTMDVTAVTALLSLLNPLEILLALILILLTAELLKPILKQFSEAGAYPFLPIVLITNTIILSYLLLGGPETLTSLV